MNIAQLDTGSWTDDAGAYQKVCGITGVILDSDPTEIAAAIGTPAHNLRLSYGGSQSGPHQIGEWVYWQKAVGVQVGFHAHRGKIKLGVRMTQAPPTNTLDYSFTLTGLTRSGRQILLDGDLVYEVELPFAVDSAGTRVNCLMTDSTITVPQEFLDNAVYPVYVDPTIVGVTDNFSAVLHGSTRYFHYANGHYWCAFHTGTRASIYSASDFEGAWTFCGYVEYTSGHCDSGLGFAAHFEGNYMYAAMSDDDGNHTYYRKALLNSNGTVTFWPAASDNDIGTGGENFHLYPGIIKTSDDKIFVSNNGYTSASDPRWMALSDGLEPTSWSFPTEPAPVTSSKGSRVSFHHGTDAGDVIAILPTSHGAEVAYREIRPAYYDASAGTWGAWRQNEPYNNATFNTSYNSWHFSSCQTDDDKIWMVWLNNNAAPNYRMSLGWMNNYDPMDITAVDANISTGVGATGNGLRPAICTDGTNLYVVWHDYDSGASAYTTKLFMRKYVPGTGWEDAVEVADAGSDQYTGGNNVVYIDGKIYITTVHEATVGGASTLVVLSYDVGGEEASTGHLEPAAYDLDSAISHTHAASGTGELVASGKQFLVWGDAVVFVGPTKSIAESQRYAIPANTVARIRTTGALWIDSDTSAEIKVATEGE
jgi:hypothetical protein